MIDYITVRKYNMARGVNDGFYLRVGKKWFIVNKKLSKQLITQK